MTTVTPARRGFALPGQGRGEEPEWTVLLTVAIALALGLLVQATVTGATRQAEVKGGSVSYPATWSSVREPGALFAAGELFGGVAGPRLALYEVGPAGRADSGTAIATWTLRLAERHLGFHVTEIRPENVSGRAVTQIEYVYVIAQAASAPVLMRGIDTVAVARETAYVLSFVAPADRFDELATRRFPRFSSAYHDIVASWRLP